MEFKPEEVDSFLKFFETIKERIEAMPGNVKLKLYQDVENPNVIFTHSLWLNTESLNNYRNSDAFAEIWPKTKVLFSDRPKAWSLELK